MSDLHNLVFHANGINKKKKCLTQSMCFEAFYDFWYLIIKKKKNKRIKCLGQSPQTMKVCVIWCPVICIFTPRMVLSTWCQQS